MRNIAKYLGIVIMLSGCTLIIDPMGNNLDPEKVLLETCDIIRNYYPYLSYKHIKIDSIYSFYRNRLMDYEGDRIYNLLYNVLYELRDGHVSFYTLGGYEIQPFIPRRKIKDNYSYDPIVVRKYFNDPLILVGDKNIEYEVLPNNIGYVYISTMKLGNGRWIQEFDDVIQQLLNTKGIILDVRNNGGGSSIIAEYIVSIFLQEPIQSPIWLDARGNDRERHAINPIRYSIYNGEIIVLQNGTCFSATEGFINVMRELPNVTTIGDTTGGGSGAPENFDLSNNLTIRLSTKVQLTYQRKYIEWNGIEPDILVQQTKRDLENGNDLQLEAAIEYLNNIIPN